MVKIKKDKKPASPKKPEKTKPVIEKKLIDRDAKEKKKKKNMDKFHSFIYRLLKQRAPNIGISSKSMVILNSMLIDWIELISSEAGKLALIGKKNTIGHHEVRSALKLILPGELASEAVLDGVKALRMYQNS